MSPTTLVLFTVAGLLATSGWVQAHRMTGGEPKKFVQSIERHSSAVLLFDDQGVVGEFHISHGAPVWKAEYLEQVEKKAAVADGKRFRCGNNFWTTMENSVDITIGGTDLPAGYYYVCFEKAKDGVNLVAFDGNELRAKRVLSFNPPQSGGIVLPMTMTRTDDEEENLTCDFVVGNQDGATQLEVAWGPFVLSAPVEVRVGA